ncbi:MAG: proline--tRNA ligase [Candidatus Eisenbacteria bacterium]|uniref:Proline--tRNA ligase n=1 Tax=Eiseniibacteriota bacterium TaxID=2212470 RepID=A0A538SH18_UNCEI|nr:MAG: proline--tRNA ligase [Candidatus Eisenbacteria bacterium]TMQ58920.1 MAG: proline--tRNA ligase [Candidatus Eisenbacteria bacterium]
MRLSRAFLPTLKEDPADAELVSHKLMVRSGMLRKLAAGVYTILPLGWRVTRKVEQIVREEMDRAGGQELRLPILMPAELWQETGRWEKYGKELFRERDRHDRDYVLGPTHEEAITDLVRNHIRSYRDLPLNLYQIQTKFRDEIRPRFGVMRAREFLMKDGYSFHTDEAQLAASYEEMRDAYAAVFRRCGLEFVIVEADSGAIGGDVNHEFMVTAESGESLIFSSACGYAASSESAKFRVEPAPPEKEAPLTKRETPGRKTVEEVSSFLGVEPGRLLKSLVFFAGPDPVLAVVPGDRELNEAKLARVLGHPAPRLATAEEIEKLTGGPLGFTGPVGIRDGLRTILDVSVQENRNYVTGGNAPDLHLLNVRLGRDVEARERADLSTAREGDRCPRCGDVMRLSRGIEVGHIFKLGTKYSEAMRATYLDAEGNERIIVMGTYGIGITRTVAAVIEQLHDENGIAWPFSVAPYHVHVVPVNVSHPETREVAESLYAGLEKAGIEVLLDDRDERPGAKFKDADLIGVPLRVTIGERGLKDGVVELRDRKTGQVDRIPVGNAAGEVRKRVEEALRKLSPSD